MCASGRGRVEKERGGPYLLLAYTLAEQDAFRMLNRVVQTHLKVPVRGQDIFNSQMLLAYQC